MAGIGSYKKGKKFTLKSGNKPSSFKLMGATSVAPAASAMNTGGSPLQYDDNYKGKTKAEVTALVRANNQGKKASDKTRKSVNTELQSWRIQNRDTEVKKKEESAKHGDLESASEKTTKKTIDKLPKPDTAEYEKGIHKGRIYKRKKGETRHDWRDVETDEEFIVTNKK